MKLPCCGKVMHMTLDDIIVEIPSIVRTTPEGHTVIGMTHQSCGQDLRAFKSSSRGWLPLVVDKSGTKGSA